MKILAIAHSAVISEYRKKYYYIAKHSDIDLKLIVPDKWNEFNKWQRTKKNNLDNNFDLKIHKPIILWRKKPLLNTTYFFPQLIKELLNFKPDIIDIWEEPYSFITSYTIFLNKILKMKAKIVFFSAQNIFKKFPFPFNKIQNYVLKNANFSFPISKNVVNVLKQQGYKKGYKIMPLGIDLTIFNKQKTTNKNNITIGFCGRLEKVKGVDLFIKLAKEKKYSNFKFKIVGSGSLFNYVKNKIKNHKNISLSTNLSHTDMPNFYSKIDILIVPSRTMSNIKEQFGRVIIEAMASKCLVIGSDSGEIPNIIENNNFIFKENNYHSLKNTFDNSLNFLNENINLNLLLDENLIKVKKEYSWELIANIIINSYKEILD